MKKLKPEPGLERPKAKTGRPCALVDDDKTIATLSGLARIQCTTKEASAVLAVSEPTFFAFLKRCKKARETWDFGRDNGLASLRRNQFRMSETNATMAIWLGKQHLGQKDSQFLDVNSTITFSQTFETFIRALSSPDNTKVINGTLADEST